MSLKDYKISDDAVQNVYVQSQPDILNGTTQENKAVFDKYPALIKDRFNAVLEILGGDSAASEILIQAIEGLTAGNVQQALAELKRLLDAYIAKIKSAAGAAEVGVSTIGGMSASNTQQALAELKRLIDNLVIGTLPPGSVTADMIADGAIVQLGALLAIAAAAAYDPEGSYAVGDYCTHGGKLHKCGTPIPDGEAWNAEHWTETTVAAELAEVRASLSNKVDGSFEYTSGADFDELIPASGEIALYRAYNPVAHIPPGYEPGACDFMVIAMSESSHSWVRQIAIDFRSSAVWNRFSIGGETIPEWRDWKEIATATPPQEVPLPLAGGVTELNVATAEKTQEGIVLVNAWVGFDSPVIANTETQVAIMPENMRPKKTVGVSAIVNSGDDENLGFARISIDSGGVMRILSDISFSFAVFSIAFPVGK